MKGVRYADLSWSGSTASQLDVYRNGARITTVANDSSHTDRIGGKGAGTFRYKLCGAGTTTCSNEAAIIF